MHLGTRQRERTCVLQRKSLCCVYHQNPKSECQPFPCVAVLPPSMCLEECACQGIVWLGRHIRASSTPLHETWDKPKLLPRSGFELSSRLKSILPDSIRGKLFEVSLSIVEMSNSFQWSSNCIPKVIPNAFSGDFISSKSLISKWPSTLSLKDHRTGPTRLSERISWIDRCR